MGDDVKHPGPIEQSVLLLRGQRVLLGCDFTSLYGVETRNWTKLFSAHSNDSSGQAT
jgi:hypothetical protein